MILATVCARARPSLAAEGYRESRRIAQFGMPLRQCGSSSGNAEYSSCLASLTSMVFCLFIIMMWLFRLRKDEYRVSWTLKSTLSRKRRMYPAMCDALAASVTFWLLAALAESLTMRGLIRATWIGRVAPRRTSIACQLFSSPPCSPVHNKHVSA